MKFSLGNLKHLSALAGALILLALSLAPGQNDPASAQGGGGNKSSEIRKIVPYVFRGDLRKLPHVPSKPKIEVELQEPPDTKPAVSGQAPGSPAIALAPMPAASQNFPGISRTSSCTGGQCGAGIPPDTNGDVGLNHYIQAVNSAFAIYSKTGTLLASFTEDSLWAGSGKGACDGNSQGDLWSSTTRWQIDGFSPTWVSRWRTGIRSRRSMSVLRSPAPAIP